MSVTGQNSHFVHYKNTRRKWIWTGEYKKTRQAIFNAFEELLAEKRYEQITVQDIIEKANIGRSTFYAHFETKDELLKAVCQELFSHVFENHPAAELSHDFSCESAELFWACFKASLKN